MPRPPTHPAQAPTTGTLERVRKLETGVTLPLTPPAAGLVALGGAFLSHAGTEVGGGGVAVFVPWVNADGGVGGCVTLDDTTHAIDPVGALPAGATPELFLLDLVVSGVVTDVTATGILIYTVGSLDRADHLISPHPTGRDFSLAQTFINAGGVNSSYFLDVTPQLDVMIAHTYTANLRLSVWGVVA